MAVSRIRLACVGVLISGISLIEMLVALSITIVMLMVMTRIVLVYQGAWRHQLNLHAHQEMARKVYALIRDNVHAAGHVGCRAVSDDFRVRSYGGLKLDRAHSLRIVNNKLEVMSLYFPSAILIKPMRNTTLLYVDAGAWFHRGQYLVVADCVHAEIFQVADVTPEHDYQILRTVKPLVFAYAVMAEVGRLDSRELYTDEGLIVHKRMSGQRIRYVDNVRGLRFADDGKGIAFEFDTHVGGGEWHWYGYAARWL